MSDSGIINHPLRDEPGLKTKQINDHPRPSVNTREVSEGSMGSVIHWSRLSGIDGALQNSEDLYIDKRPYRRV